MICDVSSITLSPRELRKYWAKMLKGVGPRLADLFFLPARRSTGIQPDGQNDSEVLGGWCSGFSTLDWLLPCSFGQLRSLGWVGCVWFRWLLRKLPCFS